jgi:hypothetical protein
VLPLSPRRDMSRRRKRGHVRALQMDAKRAVNL